MAAPNNVDRLLNRVLDGTVVRTEPGSDGTTALEVGLRGRTTRLRALWAGTGTASEIQRTLDLVPDPWPGDLVVVARELSPGALSHLRDRDANWADNTGRARIRTGELLVIRDVSQLEAEPSQRQFAWSASATVIAEVLLAQDWPEGVGTGTLAKLAGWSPPQTSEVLLGFDARGWTRKRGPQRGPGARREIVDPDGLLLDWAKAVTGEELERRVAHRSIRDVMRFLVEVLAPNLEERVRWAAGGWAASQFLAPFATAVPTLQLHVAEEDFYGPLTAALEASGLHEVGEGGRVEFTPIASRLLDLGSSTEEIPLVSAPRVYCDLLRLGARGEDVAEHLKTEVIDLFHRPFSLREPSPTLSGWVEESVDRVRSRVASSDEPELFRHGYWVAAYRLIGARGQTTVTDLADVLATSVGSDTGWPVWNPRVSPPALVGESLEGAPAWERSRVFRDPGHADFWRAKPPGLFLLYRGYQEDGDIPNVEAGTTFDLILPVWRMAECLRHGGRVGRALGATRIEFLACWTGLANRELRAVAGTERFMPPGRTATQDTVSSTVEARVDAIDRNLPELVRAVTQPVYATFHLFRPPDAMFGEEIARMLSG